MTNTAGVRAGTSLADAVVIVTGAGRGLGVEIVRMFAAQGAKLLVADVNSEGLAATAELALAEGAADVMTLCADLCEQANTIMLAEMAAQTWGRIDVLVNNAGGGVIQPFLQHDAQSLKATLERNLWTTLWCCHSVLPYMVEQGYGRVVNIGAESVRNGLDSHAGYNAAKGGVNGLTTGLAREFARKGITVNTVAPSGIMTPEIRQMLDPDSAVYKTHQIRNINEIAAAIPIGRIAEMAEVAAVVVFVASPAASFVTGQVISVNGGSSML